MRRTTIMLPDDMRTRATQLARHMGISLGELIRKSLTATLDGSREQGLGDPLLADDAVYRGEAPPDLSAHHDDYLYGEDG